MRRATFPQAGQTCHSRFLSTLSLRRATRNSGKGTYLWDISIHALLAESDRKCLVKARANPISIHALLAESDYDLASFHNLSIISIHALLAESDHITNWIFDTNARFLSTLSLRRATYRKPDCIVQPYISIHALLAESDINIAPTVEQGWYFYPRSPCGERRRWQGGAVPIY